MPGTKNKIHNISFKKYLKSFLCNLYEVSTCFLPFLDEVQIRTKAHFYKLYWRNRLLFPFLWTFTDQSIVLPNVTWISYYIYWSLSKVFYEKEILNIHVCGYDAFYTGLTISGNSQFVDRPRQQGYSRYETNEIMTRNVVKISIFFSNKIEMYINIGCLLFHRIWRN